MKLGFTGTREGLSIEQRGVLKTILQSVDGIQEAHHGDCIGADEGFHDLCLVSRVPEIVLHPGTNWKGESPTRAHCERIGPPPVDGSISVLLAKPYLKRDKDIVEATDQLIACPKGPEKLRSGTWATVRYARKRSRTYKITIIYPDGSVHFE